jgi:hypothetical protein
VIASDGTDTAQSASLMRCGGHRPGSTGLEALQVPLLSKRTISSADYDHRRIMTIVDTLLGCFGARLNSFLPLLQSDIPVSAVKRAFIWQSAVQNPDWNWAS